MPRPVLQNSYYIKKKFELALPPTWGKELNLENCTSSTHKACSLHIPLSLCYTRQFDVQLLTLVCPDVSFTKNFLAWSEKHTYCNISVTASSIFELNRIKLKHILSFQNFSGTGLKT